MTDRADSARAICKLLNVASRARQVTGELRSDGSVIALVTQKARKPGMHGVTMMKLREILGVQFCRNRRRIDRRPRFTGSNKNAITKKSNSHDKNRNLDSFLRKEMTGA
jgi:hypothetical protein